MKSKKGIIASWLMFVLGSAAICGCTKPPLEQTAVVEEPPAPQTSEALSPPPQATEMPALPPAKLEEVQGAVKRIFKDAVLIDASRGPGFLVGDFNGDLSQDLAIVLKPAEGMISELNQEFPNWLAREPLEDVLPKSKVVARSTATKPVPNPAGGQTVRFLQSDILLAIIHGRGPSGWRDPEATQTHLLRDVVGTNMRIMPLKEAVKTYRRTRPFPMIYGDLIQQTLIGQSGFLHFEGGMYGWYDPKNYKAQQIHMPHSGMAMMTK